MGRSRSAPRPTGIIIPAIVFYELKRELLRAGKSFSVSRLDVFTSRTPGRYLPLSDEALRLAADLCEGEAAGEAKTTDARDVDIDVISSDLSALFWSSPNGCGDRHEQRQTQFIAAQSWTEVVP